MDLNEMNLNMVDFEGEDDVQINNPIQEVEEPVVDTIETPSFTSGEGVSPNTDSNSNNQNNKDIMSDFLKFNGISDMDHIKFEDEDGIVRDRSWNDLSYDEKMNILTTSYQQPERDLDDDEIKLLNDMRSKKLSPEQYINTIRQQAIQDYSNLLDAQPQYSIKDLSDDEIFILDLQDKIEDISDEEILNALNKAKEDPLFEKRIAGMRKSFEAQEEAYNQQIAAERAEQEQLQFENFKGSVLNGIQSFDKVGDLDINLEVEDMEDIASFILDKDDTGVTYLGRALNDPQTLVEVSWWLLKGRDALNSISEYFSNEIKNVRQTSYQKGLEEGRNNSSRVVYKPQVQSQPVQNTNGQQVTIDDIFG